jgi:murein DD-endopeptidase MepM/ murein hydrolase activator NlpD
VTSVARAPVAAAPPEDDRRIAARQLEAFFLRRLLAEARPHGGGLLDGGFAGETFKQLLDETLADKMSEGAGIGMAAMFEAQLGAPAGAASPHRQPVHVAAADVGLPRPAQPAAALTLPVHGHLTSAYGHRNDPIRNTPIMHAGLDLAAPTGTPVVAAAEGTVSHAGPAGTYGNLVIVRHPGGLETRYAHLSTVAVHVGEVVAAGQAVGAVGTTGHSTGPHLHFELRRDGKAIDPAPSLPLHGSQTRPIR